MGRKKTDGNPGMMSVVEQIDPTIARCYLEANTQNRRVRRTWVAQLVKIMRDGDWRLNHQGIAFNCDGSLKDGQHRLMAIVESGVTILVMVTRGLPGEAMETIDVHQRRTEADVMNLMGFEVNHHMVAVARRMKEGILASEDTRMTRPEVIRFVATHDEAIRFSLQGSKMSGVYNTSVRAPIARAWYTADRSRLAAFIDCLGSGMPAGAGDAAAIVFRNSLLRESHKAYGSGGFRATLYRRAEYALVAFLKGRPVTKALEVSREQFPLPGETP